MKTLKIIVILTSVVLTLSSCGRRFSNTSYQRSDFDNKTLAVLPYKVVTTGRIPREVTDEMLMDIELAESKAFQASLYHQILDRLSTRRYSHLNVKVQAYDETNRKLEKAGYTITDSWSLTASELAEVLGVDAVIQSSVHKTQYLTDLESYGIFLARNVVAAVGGQFWLFPNNTTSDVRISTTIIDTRNGNALWSASRICPTDWNTNTYDAIERINYRISRKLPR